jgi:outer membrane protein
LRAKAKEVYQQAESVNQALAGWKPTVQAVGSASHVYTDNQAQNRYNTKSTTYSSPLQGQVEATQNLFNGWGTVAQTAQAEAAVFAKMAEFVRTEQDVLVEAANAYLTLWLKKAVLQLNIKNVDLKKATLEQVKARAGVGELTLTDVAQAEAELAGAMSKKINTEAEVLTAHATYVRVVGEAPTDLTPPREFLNTLEIPKLRDDAIQKALHNNPAIENAMHASKSAEAAIDVAQASLLPSVDASISGSQYLQTTNNPDSRGTSATFKVQLKIPLYQGGAEYSKVRSARQGYSKAKVDLASLRNQAIEQTVQVWEKWQSAKAQIEQTKIRIEAQQLTLEGVRQEFMVGEKTTKDVLDAENNLLQAETDLVTAEQTYFLTTYQLLAAMGLMTPRHLDLPIEPYPLQAQYEEIRKKWIGFGNPSER